MKDIAIIAQGNSSWWSDLCNVNIFANIDNIFAFRMNLEYNTKMSNKKKDEKKGILNKN